MFRIKFTGALLLCTFCASAVVWAQEPSVTLGRAVEAAWARAIEAAESTGQTRRADAALQAAQAPWAAAPSVEIGQQRDTNAQGNGRESHVAVTVPLWLPGQRAARVNAASAEQESAQAARNASRLKIAAQVREAQGHYYLQQAERTAAEAQLRTLTDLTRDVERRVAAGDLARTDSLAAMAEQLAAQATTLDAGDRLASALSRWRALTSLGQVPLVEPVSTQLSASVPESHPVLKAVGLAVQVAQRRLDAVQVTRRDPPEVTVGARHEVSGGGGASTRGIGVSLRIPFATADRNQPLIASALADLDLAHAREDRARVELASELEIAHAGLQTARRSVADETRRSGLLRERYALLERSWRAGNTALSDLLRALTAAAQAEGDLQRRKAALDLANARVQQALGILP